MSNLSLEKMLKTMIDTTIVENLIQKVEKTYGAVHKGVPAIMNGRTGFLIWDYIIFNELTFIDDESGNITSLFTTFSDVEMDERFAECKVEYGT